MNWKEYKNGVQTGLPVGLGYFSVSFGFGAMAIAQGLSALNATLISATNLTSAGQFAGLTLIVAMGTLWEMVMTQIVINSRYSLMSIALSQRMGQRIGFFPRLFIAFFNTDEIFALAMARKEVLTVPFMLGLGTLPIIGWTGGTLMGAFAGRHPGGSGCDAVRHVHRHCDPPGKAGKAGVYHPDLGPDLQLPLCLGTCPAGSVRRYFHRHLHGSSCSHCGSTVPHCGKGG